MKLLLTTVFAVALSSSFSFAEEGEKKKCDKKCDKKEETILLVEECDKCDKKKCDKKEEGTVAKCKKCDKKEGEETEKEGTIA
jgi:hypothetical protein